MLNQKLINCWEKLNIEAKQALETLQSRLNKPGDFLHDFNMEAKVSSFIYVPGENGDMYEAENCIEEVLIDSLEDDNYAVNHYEYFNEECLNCIPYLNRECNWNVDSLFKGKFNEHFISQAIHDLYDHTNLSFPDILRINHLWAELRIEHQHFVEV